MSLEYHHRSGNVLAYMHDRRFSAADIRCVGAMLLGNARAVMDNLPRMARDEAYTPPVDEISRQLVQLLDVLKGMLKHSDYTTIESRIGAIMTASRTRTESHQAELNELSNSASTNKSGPPKTPGKPASPVAQDSDPFARRSGADLDNLLYGEQRRAAAEQKHTLGQLQQYLDRIQVI